MNSDRFGAHAEFVSVREKAPIAIKPAGVTFEEAAAVSDGAILAFSGLRAGGVQAGTRILVYGASGSIGTAGVQLAKHLGAHVTAVCNTRNVEIVRSLGADEVIDYEQDDFAENGETYDLVLDAVGKISLGRCRASLSRGGVYIGADLGFLWQNPFLALVSKKVKFPIPRYRKDEVVLIGELMEKGEYRAVIDRRYPLEEVVDATRYVETGQKTGNVVLTVSNDLSEPREDS